jgi:hypothetical protein
LINFSTGLSPKYLLAFRGDDNACVPFLASMYRSLDGTNKKTIPISPNNPIATTAETVKNIAGNFINIYPNPTTGKFQLAFSYEQLTSGVSPVFNISVINILGEVVYDAVNQTVSPSTQIDLSKQPKGIYFVKIQGADKVYTEKVVVE